jgi:hypothetical protein
MKVIYRIAAVAAGTALGVAALAGAASAAPTASNGSKSAFFTDGNGAASWVNNNNSVGQSNVIQLSSPNGTSYGGFVGHGIDGVAIGNITALSYDFQVTTPKWTSGGGGSPRLVVDLSDGGSLALNPVAPLVSGTWVHMDALKGALTAPEVRPGISTRPVGAPRSPATPAPPCRTRTS